MDNPFTITVVADVHEASAVLPAIPDVSLTPMLGLAYLLAHCTILTFDGICRRQRLTVAQYRCCITARQRTAHPRIYEAVTMQMRVVGDSVRYDRLRYGFHLIPKYCPVHATLAATCHITHELWNSEHDAYERID